MSEAKFPLGRVVITAAAQAELTVKRVTVILGKNRNQAKELIEDTKKGAEEGKRILAELKSKKKIEEIVTQ